MKRALIPAVLMIAGAAQAERWSPANNPNMITRMTKKPLVTKLTELPLESNLKDSHFIWSDTYWPANKGGIAYRWNAEPEPQNFTYKKYSRAELRNMSTLELERLSPSEKYDIYMGNYDYPLTRKVLAENNPRELWWEGICHGWAQAAVMHPEPNRVDLRNADGIMVPFGSSDVKALLDFYYAKVHKTTERFQIGKRCRVQGKVPGEDSDRDRVRTEPNSILANSPDCADTNAGAFHLALTNMVGINDMGFVVEVDRYNDIWNQPMGEYKSWVVSERAASSGEVRNGAAKIVRVRTDMTYGEELNLLEPSQRNDVGGFMSMLPVTNTPNNTKLTKNYEYTLELDAAGNVIGGRWLTKTRPDFIWAKGKATRFLDGNYGLAGLNRIYQPVR